MKSNGDLLEGFKERVKKLKEELEAISRREEINSSKCGFLRRDPHREATEASLKLNQGLEDMYSA